MAEFIIGIIISVLGLYSTVKGKIPFIKRYNGVKNIRMHSRIEGSAGLLVGIMMISQCFVPIGTVGLVISILSICILTLILEIILKVI